MSFSPAIQIAMELWGAILCFIFIIFIWLGDDRRSGKSTLLAALIAEVMLLLVSDSVAWATRGQAGAAASILVRASNYMVFLLNFVSGFTCMVYLETLIGENGRQIRPGLRIPICAVCLLGAMEVTVSQFTGFLYTIGSDNLYCRADGYWTICVVAGLMLVLLILCIWKYAGCAPAALTFPLLSICLLPLFAEMIQVAFYGISLTNISMTVGVAIMFIGYEKNRVMQTAEKERKLLEHSLQIAQQQTELARKDAELAMVSTQLAEKRTQIMLSQIRPHFLYNALSAISILCIKDPAKAKTTIDCFSEYLRTNLDSLTSDRLVPFSEELAHTQAYLSIEQLRFGDDLHMEYDIRCRDFKVPSLSVQPIVENAVRHGVRRKEDGGTVTIRTEEASNGYRIYVADDGAGFDTEAAPDSSRSHIGLENVRQRLQVQAGGSLTIESAPDKGTTVTIFLPKNQQ